MGILIVCVIVLAGVSAITFWEQAYFIKELELDMEWEKDHRRNAALAEIKAEKRIKVLEAQVDTLITIAAEDVDVEASLAKQGFVSGVGF